MPSYRTFAVAMLTACTLLASASTVSAQGRGPSTPEEWARIVAMAAASEKD